MGILLAADYVDVVVELTLAILATTLLFVLAQSIKQTALEWWTLAWGSQALGLSVLLAGANWRGGGETNCPWAYGLAAALGWGFTLVGCRRLTGDRAWDSADTWALVGLAVAALVGPLLIDTVLPHPQQGRTLGRAALFLATGAVQGIAALVALTLTMAVHWHTDRRRTGLRLLMFALFCHVGLSLGVGGIVMAWQVAPELWPGFSPGDWLRFQTVVQTLLAFGMIIVALEGVRRELERANAELANLSQRLARQAQSDAMTEALNRHAFYTLIESRRSGLSVPGDGALAVLDLDHLKPLNDQFGHAAGDAAIRAVAKAVRSIIRPDDLLFRWGGDEFLVILPNVPADEAERRLATLASKLRGTELPGVGEPVDLDVSYGVASFTTLGGIEAAMAQADAAMYAHKADRKLLQPDLPRPAAGG